MKTLKRGLRARRAAGPGMGGLAPFILAAGLGFLVPAWAQAQELPNIEITGNRDSDEYLTPDAGTANKMDVPIMETPMNIQVITRQALDDQFATTLDKALTNVSGVISNSFGQGQETLYLRGFQTFTTFLNGFRISDNTSGLRTLTNVDSIEVLKGAAAILYGDIEPGGLVNLTTRQPQKNAALFFEQGVGSWDHSLTNFNATGPLDADKTLLYQFNASYEYQRSWVDQVYDRKAFVAPTLQFNVDPATRVVLEYEYTHNPFIFDNAQLLPIVNGGFVRVPMSTNVGTNLPYSVDTQFGQLRVAHAFDDDWSLKFQAGKHIAEAKGYTPTSFPTVTPVPGNFTVTGYVDTVAPGIVEDDGASLNVIGKFSLAGVRNTALLGAEWYRYADITIGAGGSANSYYTVNLIDPVYPPAPGMNPADPNYGSFNYTSYDHEEALYLNDQADLPYHLHASLGLRWDRLRDAGTTSFSSPNASPPTSSTTLSAPYTDNAITPRVGLIWRPVDTFSLYGNYAGNLTSNMGSVNYLGQLLGDSHARQFEGGVKAESPKEELRATLAYFKLDKTNVPVQDTDPAHIAASVLPSYLIMTLLGELQSRGLEFDLDGSILPQWKVILTYAYLHTEVTQSNAASCANGGYCVGYRFANVPTQVSSLWTTYEFRQAGLQGLKIGAGASGQNSSPSGDNTLHYPGFFVVNAMMGYGMKTGYGKLSLQLNVNNVLNRYYFTGNYAAGGYGFAAVNFGPPRNAMADIRLDF